ncbi:MAG: CRISPR-associated endonuclease Cas1 [Thermoanaerobaculum sp.]
MGKTVAITEQGTSLHLSGEVLELRKSGKRAMTIKLAELEQLLLFGQVELTHAATVELLKRNVDVVFLSRGGRFYGRLVTRASRHVDLRVRQYRVLGDEARAFSLAKSIVAAKVKNQRHLLLRAQASLGDERIAEILLRLRHLAEDAASAQNREELLGIEGAAAQAYFSGFALAIRNPLFSFSGRNRRPPRDPVNACLSFGYALLATLAEGEVAACGLDPLLGAFHQPEYGRPSLALDVMEEFRAPIVDAVVLRLINRRQLVPADFGSPSEAFGEDQLALPPGEVGENKAVYLLETGRKIFLKEFLRRLREEVFDPRDGVTVDFRSVLRGQIYRIARFLRDEGTYEPFIMR